MLLKLLTCFLLNNFFLNLGSAGIASFNPRQKGEYKVCVMRNEKHIKNSPFRLQIGDKELGHAAGCKVSGAIDKSIANHPNTVEIDTTNAGKFSCYLAVSFCHKGKSAGLELLLKVLIFVSNHRLSKCHTQKLKEHPLPLLTYPHTDRSKVTTLLMSADAPF